MDESLPHLFYGKGYRVKLQNQKSEVMSAVTFHQGREQQAEWEVQRLRCCFSKLRDSSCVSLGFLEMAKLIPRDPYSRVAQSNLV